MLTDKNLCQEKHPVLYILFMIVIKTPKEIDLMQRVNQIVAQSLKKVIDVIEPGITTLELDAIAESHIRAKGAVPAFLGYHGYPKSLCVSINEEVVHGIPSKRKIESGDVVSLDLGAIKDGFVGDSAFTVAVGHVPERTRKLIRASGDALYKGIDQARAGNRLYDISAAIQNHVESFGFSVVRQYVGHGIGRNMHEDPQIPNFGKAGTGIPLRDGMTFAIEPMVNMGGWEVVLQKDGWTVVTSDKSISVHFEHSIAITKNGPIILSELS